jgi:hypothetical protein
MYGAFQRIYNVHILAMAVSFHHCSICLSGTWLEHMKEIYIYIYTHLYMCVCEQGSSVSTVSGYGLDDRSIEVRSPAEAKNFSCNLCVQTGSGVHPVSCTMGTGDPSPGAKVRPGRHADHSPPSSPEVMNQYELYILSPQAPSWRVVGQL